MKKIEKKEKPLKIMSGQFVVAFHIHLKLNRNNIIKIHSYKKL